MVYIYVILAILVILAAVVAINTARKKPKAQHSAKSEDIAVDACFFAQNLSGMIKLRTITSDHTDGFDRQAFLGFHKYLENTYPLIHSKLKKEVVNEYSLLYKWTGTGSSKKPFLMAAHMDVVPVDERTADKWEHGAFSGDIAGGYIWGRGAIDMKGQLAAVMESVEYLLRQGFAPNRDIYIALGHDEERMGLLGASKIARRLEEEGIRFDFVIDEGGATMDGEFIGIKSMVSLIGICEKGYADIRLTASSEGGHSSKPPRQTAVGTLAKAVVALEKHQMRASLNKPLRLMLDAAAPYMKFPLNVIASNLFLTKPLLLKKLASSSFGSALTRTTVAPTMLKGSAAPNVLAERAEAVINSRISPDDSLQILLKHIEKTVGGDIEVEIISAHKPSVMSDTDSEAYRLIAQTARETMPGYVIAPFLVVVATDSRWYTAVADNVYRFQPFRSLSEDMDTIHSTGERLKIDSLCEAAEFFIRLVKKAAE